MKVKQWLQGMFVCAVAAFVVAGCANQMEPAKKAIADIEAAVASAGADAEKYVPDEVQAVRDEVANLKAQFDKKDYKGVLAGAPAVLAKAQALAGSAAAKKTEAMDALNGEWGSLAASVPQAVAAIQSRVDMLSRSKKLPASVSKDTFEAAKTGIADATTMWSQATAAQAAGDLEQAVGLARQVKEKADALLASLGMTAG
jgi:hypothetical protein